MNLSILTARCSYVIAVPSPFSKQLSKVTLKSMLLSPSYWNYGVCVRRFHIFSDSTPSLACPCGPQRASP